MDYVGMGGSDPQEPQAMSGEVWLPPVEADGAEIRVRISGTLTPRGGEGQAPTASMQSSQVGGNRAQDAPPAIHPRELCQPPVIPRIPA